MPVNVASQRSAQLAPRVKYFSFGLAGFVAAVLLIGIVGDWLLRPGPAGINVTVLTLATLGIVIHHARKHRLLTERPAHITLGAACVFSLLYCWRDVGPTSLLVLFVIAVSVVLTAAQRIGRDPRNAYLWNYAQDAFNFAMWALLLPFTLAFRSHRTAESAAHPVSATGLAVARGVLIAAPLIVVLGSLLVSADALFEKFLTDLFDFDLDTVFSHVVVFAFCAWSAAAVWWQCLEGPVGNTTYRTGERKPFALGAVEINVALGLVTALFMTFIAFQVRYFFGGHERVLTEAGLTYADYARRGFFELATVAGIALAVLVLCSRLVETAGPRGRRIFTFIAAAFVLSVLTIVASAFHRMGLYIDAYGLTRERLYTASFMIWVAVVFLWLYFCVYGDRLRRFAWGLVLSGYAATFALLAINPDATIARFNMERAIDGKPLDIEYMRTLSFDAVPVLVRMLPSLEGEEHAHVQELLNSGAIGGGRWDSRTWTWGRARAALALESLDT
jgi:hypothetical protein